MSIDVVGDFLTVMRNALKVNKRSATVPSSNLKVEIARVLKDEGYIKDFAKKTDERGKALLTVTFKYVDGESAIHKICRVSTPGCRQYEGIKGMDSVIGGLGIKILTTSAGVMTDQKAKKMSVGGEVICYVW